MIKMKIHPVQKIRTGIQASAEQHLTSGHCIITCMNCDLNALFVARGCRMRSHRRHLHLGYCGYPQNHTQFCSLMEVAKAKNILTVITIEKKNKKKAQESFFGLEC